MSSMEELMKAMGLPTGFHSKKINKPTSQLVVDLPNSQNSNSSNSTLMTKLTKDKSLENKIQSTSDVDSSDTDQEDMPFTQSANLKGHSRVLSAITLDPSGSRLITGARDNHLYLWNFNTMDKRLAQFKSFEPVEGNIITDLQFGSSGDKFLLATPESCVRILDRDGYELSCFTKGDPYVRDPRRTMGHTSSITSARWHPIDKHMFYTTSMDSTIRIWDSNDSKQQKCVIPVKSKSIGNRTHITSACTSPDGKQIVAAGQDGVLRLWPFKGPFIMPTKVLENAHTPGSAVSSCLFLSNNIHLVTRGMDDSMKIFDLRNFKQPLVQHFNLWNRYECTDVISSPDQKYILTGTSVKKDQEPNGKIMIYDSTNFKLVKQVQVSQGSCVVRLNWHSRINQIFCGLSNGDCQVYYNPMTCVGGIKEALSREPRKRAIDDIEYNSAPVEIEAPEDEALFPEEEEDRKIEYIKKKMDNLVDPRDLRKPTMPPLEYQLPKRGAKVKTGTSLTEFMMKSIVKDRTVNDDPREAILKYAEEAEKDPYWVAPAYKKNQPVNKLAPFVYEDEDEAKREARKKRKQ